MLILLSKKERKKWCKLISELSSVRHLRQGFSFSRKQNYRKMWKCQTKWEDPVFFITYLKKNTASVCWKKDSMFYFINMLNSVIYCSVYFHMILLLILCSVRSVKFIWPTQLKLSHFDKNSKYNGTQSNFLQISFLYICQVVIFYIDLIFEKFWSFDFFLPYTPGEI